MELDTLPDFMKSSSPQVKFHSAFPPLTTKVRVRGVMERAGFDVYKPEKNRSLSNKTRSPTINDLSNIEDPTLYPPAMFSHSKSSPRKQNKARSLSYGNRESHSASSLQNGHSNAAKDGELLKNPALSKGRNFTTNPVSYANNSTPNLLNESLASPSSSSSKSLKKKHSILDYAKEKLNLHTNKQKQEIPIVTERTSQPIGQPDLVVPNLQSANFEPNHVPDIDNSGAHTEMAQAYSNDTETLNLINQPIGVPVAKSNHLAAEERNDKDDFDFDDPFKSSTKLPPNNFQQLNGPRPYLESDSDSEDQENKFNFESQHNDTILYTPENVDDHKNISHDVISNSSSFQTTNTTALHNNVLEHPQPNPNVLNTPARIQRDEDSLSSRSSPSAQSVGSFDEKFMLQGADAEGDHNQLNVNSADFPKHDASQESLAGLGGLRETIILTEVTPLVPDITSPYDKKIKRVSTLATDDMNIYNLQSLNDQSTQNDNYMHYHNGDQNNADDNLINTTTTEANAMDFSDDYTGVSTTYYGNNLNPRNEVSEMTMIQEGEFEDSRIDGSKTESQIYDTEPPLHIPELKIADTPEIVIHHDNDNESILGNDSFPPKVDSNDYNNITGEVTDNSAIPEISDSLNTLEDPEVAAVSQDYNTKETEGEINDNELLSRGFTKRNASATSASNLSNSPSFPKIDPVAEQSIADKDTISAMITDINNFGIEETYRPTTEREIDQDKSSGLTDEIEDDKENIELPLRHFERSGTLSQSSDNKSINQNSQLQTPPQSNGRSHPYAALSQESYATSIDTTPTGYSSKCTTPDKDAFPIEEQNPNTDVHPYKSLHSNNLDHYNNSAYNKSADEQDKQTNEEVSLPPVEKQEYISEETQEEAIYPPGQGPCRKCGQEILASEKKIWSKDHQLSGQWHRKCFGCHKCGSKFSKGSSCYVFNNQPYCENHFHEANGSLCQICHKGVEGECLQNDVNEVFHVDCLRCIICGYNVQGDYFIFRDEVMCERDAKELMYQIEEAEKDYKKKDHDKIIKRRTRILYL